MTEFFIYSKTPFKNINFRDYDIAISDKVTNNLTASQIPLMYNNIKIYKNRNKSMPNSLFVIRKKGELSPNEKISIEKLCNSLENVLVVNAISNTKNLNTLME